MMRKPLRIGLGLALSVIAALFMLRLVSIRAQGNILNFDQPVTGAIPEGKTENWLLDASAQDVIRLDIHRTTGSLRPILNIYDPGDRLWGSTEAPEGSEGTAVLSLRVPTGGIYRVEIQGAAETSGSYNLQATLIERIERTPTAQPTLPSATAAGRIGYGLTVQGEITADNARQTWNFNGNAGFVIDLRMNALSGDLDPFLQLISPTGENIANNESSAGATNAGITAFRLPYTGEYIVVARRSTATVTAGRYELSLTLRASEDAPGNTLDPNVLLQGRFTAEYPAAAYRIDFGGNVALTLDLGGLNRLARIRVFSPLGAPISEAVGLSPLSLVLSLSDDSPYIIEFSSISADSLTSLDFTAAAYRLNIGSGTTKPLRYHDPRRTTASASDYWFLTGSQGDMVVVDIRPDLPSVSGTVRIVNPSGDSIFQGPLGAGIEQLLTLPESGIYEVEVRPTAGETISYSINATRIGINETAFGLFTLINDRGSLAGKDFVEGILSPGGSDSYWLDIEAETTLTLRASPLASINVVGMAVIQPDGKVVDTALSQNDTPALIARWHLSQTGRYRVIIFDVKGKFSTQSSVLNVAYRLLLEDASGGQLQAGQTVKGVAVRANGLALWTLNVPEGGLINARLTNLTPAAWTPTLYLADPGGRVIASAPSITGSTGVELLGVKANVPGTYTVIAAGQVVRSYASYRLLSDLLLPFSRDRVEPIRITAAQPMVGRYAPETSETSTPIRTDISALISPLVDPSQLAPAQELIADQTARGEIPLGVLGQSWRFSAITNTIFQLTAVSLSGSSPPKITLWDRNNALVAEQFRAEGSTVTLTYRVPVGGIFTAVVSQGLSGGRYLLTLTNQNLVDGALNVLGGAPILYGQTIFGEVLNSGEQDSYYFLGAANDRVNFQIIRQTGDFLPRVELFAPNGQLLASGSVQGNARLPAAGIYTLRLTAGAETQRAFGRYALYLGLLDAPRLRLRGGGIIQPGQSQAGLLNGEDGEDVWLFVGERGERVTFAAAAQGNLAPLRLRLLDTAGGAFAIRESTLTSAVIRLDEVMLPADGVYRVEVSGGGRGAGIYTLLWEQDRGRLPRGALNYGQTANGIFTATRPFETWVFSGTVGDVISISLRYARGEPFQGSFQVRAENGLVLATVADVGDGRGARTNVQLPFSGGYSVVVGNPNPNYTGAGVYALSISLQESKARSMGKVLHYGETAEGDIFADDPDDTWVFTARAGDQVRVQVRALDQFLLPEIQVRTPNGETLASALADGGTAQVGVGADNELSIPTDGVYMITIRGSANSTGTYHLFLDYTPPPLAEIDTILYGESRPGLIAADRPEEYYLFAGGQGDLVRAVMTRESGASLSPVIRIESETGEVLAFADSNDGDSVALADYALPYTGLYRLVATRYLGIQGQTAGRYTITLTADPGIKRARGTVRYGGKGIGRLDDALPVDRLSFEAQAGDVVSIVAQATSGDLDIVARLESVGGEIIASNDDSTGTNAAISGALLPETGTYFVVLSRTGRSAGNYEILLENLYRGGKLTTNTTPLVYGSRVVGTVDAVNADVARGFSGYVGDVIAIRLFHQSDDTPPTLALFDPSGAVLAEGVREGGRTEILNFRLPATGEYLIRVRRPINSRLVFSPYTLTLNLASALNEPAVGGGMIEPQTPAVGIFTPGESAHYWLFRASAGEQVAAHLLSLSSGFRPTLILIAPSGDALEAAQGELGTTQIDPLTLPVDGVYALLILPGIGTDTGRYRLTLTTDAALPPPEVILPGGSVSGLIGSLSPEGRWSFEAQAGQIVSVRVIVTQGSLAPLLSLRSTDGLVLAESALSSVNSGVDSAAIERFVLPNSGTYLLTVSAQDDRGGAYRLLLELDVPGGQISPAAAAAATISYNSQVTRSIRLGETAYFGFNAALGDTVLVSAIGGKSRTAPRLEVQDISGRALVRVEPDGKTPDTVLSSLVVPAQGRYVIGINALATDTYTLILQRRSDYLPLNPASVLSRQLLVDIPQQDNLTDSNPTDYWIFSGQAGQVIQIDSSRVNGDVRLDLALFYEGRFLASATAEGDSAEAGIAPLRIPENGTYFLTVSRWLGSRGASRGGYELHLRPLDQGPQAQHIPAYETTIAANSGDLLTFTGTAGDLIETRIAVINGSWQPQVILTAPEQTTPFVTLEGDFGGGVFVARTTLPLSGVYTLLVNPKEGEGGSYRLTLSRPMNTAQASLSRAEGIQYGDHKESAITLDSQVQAWVFYGRAGERLIAEVQPLAESNLDPFVMLLNPQGQTLITDDNSGEGRGARIRGYLLPSTGFYAVVVTSSPLAQSGAEGRFRILVERGFAGAAFQGFAPINGATVGTLRADNPLQEWLIEVEHLQLSLTLSSSAPTWDARLLIIDKRGEASGTVIAASEPGSLTLETVLPALGRYGIVLMSNSPEASGSFRLTTGSAIAPTGGGLLIPVEPSVGEITDLDYSDTWRLAPEFKGEIQISALRSSGDVNLEITVLDQAGTVILNQGANENGEVRLRIPAAVEGMTVIVSRVGGASGITNGSYTILATVLSENE